MSDDIVGALRRAAEDIQRRANPEHLRPRADAKALRDLVEMFGKAGTVIAGVPMVLVVRRDEDRVVATLEPDPLAALRGEPE